MLTLKNFINIINESGNAIKNAARIPAPVANKLYLEIENTIKEKYPKAEICALGSLGKKGVDQTHGDIDIAVVCKDIEELRDIVHNIFEPLVKTHVSEINYFTTANVVSIGWYFGELLGGFSNRQIAQVDFMSVKNLEWAKFRYASPDFTRNESQFKGAERANLLRAIIDEIPVDDNKIEYFDDGVTLKSKFKHSMLDTGIYKQFIDFTGKNGNILKNPKKVKEFEEFLLDNPDEIMKFVFGDNARPDDFKSAESLWRAFHDKKKFPYDNSVIKAIEDRFEKESLSNLNITLSEFKKIAERG